MQSLGIYIHVPYCVKKCSYCDFVSYPLDKRQDFEEYFEKLRSEIMNAAFVYRNRYYVDSIFFGGGTPSVVPSSEIVRTLNTINQNFRVCEDAEISIETNPGTLDEEKLSAYRNAGFNRISMGIQSFDDGILKTLGRIHDANTAEKAFACLGFENRNMDLMFGVPGQTIKIWEDTLKKAIFLRPEHISFYSLQLEEGTPLYESYRFGNLSLPTWEENRKMYHMAVQMLKDAGYHHYEVSNAALPGFECRHNLKYWTMKPFLGFGESAYSFIDGKRTEEDNPNLKTDFVFTELRQIDGFLLSDYTELFGTDFTDDFGDALKELLDEDLLILSGGRLRFTEKGLDYTNPVMERLINSL